LFTLFGSVIITHDLLAAILDSTVIMMCMSAFGY